MDAPERIEAGRQPTQPTYKLALKWVRVWWEAPERVKEEVWALTGGQLTGWMIARTGWIQVRLLDAIRSDDVTQRLSTTKKDVARC